MNSVKSVDWNEYDNDTRPRVVVRMSPEEKQAIQRASKDSGVTVNNLVLAFMKPVIRRHGPDGRRAHQIISNVVQAGVEHYRQGKIDAKQTGTFGHWRSMPVAVYKFPDGDSVVVHHIVQRYGKTRTEAIDEYVNKILDVWADLPTNEDREAMLDEIRNGSRLLFRLGFPDEFRRWSRFPSEYELEIHRNECVAGRVATPDGEDELRVYEAALDYLAKLWPNGSGRRHVKSNAERVRLPETIAGDDADRMQLIYYPHRPDADNISTWAGQVVFMYRHELPEYGPIGKVDAVVEMIKRNGISVRILRVET